MDKEIAQYVNTLLADKQREIKFKQNNLDKIGGFERHFTEYQETVWELGMLYKAHKAMDYIIEEEEGMQWKIMIKKQESTPSYVGFMKRIILLFIEF